MSENNFEKSYDQLFKLVELTGIEEAKEYARIAKEIKSKYFIEETISEIPTDNLEAFNLMKETAGQFHFNFLKIRHLLKYTSWQQKEVEREIKEIEHFIDYSSSQSKFKAYLFEEDFFGKDLPQDYAYIRLSENFYQTNGMSKISLFSSLPYTYAWCYLYLSFLKNKLLSFLDKELTKKEIFLRQYFDDPKQIEKVFSLLYDKDFIDGNHYWIKNGKGFKNQLRAFLSALERYNYTKEGKVHVDKKIEFLKVVFSKDVSAETLKRSPTDFEIEEFEFLARTKL